MKVEKKVIKNLNKCYALTKLHYQGKEHFIVAAEKQDAAYLFDLDGNLEDKIWDGPGGVMSMVQVPGTDGQYLSTYKFYSPNDSKEAKIVIMTPYGKGDWRVRTLVNLPHVHRFDLLERDGHVYLIACTLKSGHDYKEDWTKPGKVYGAKLPADLSGFDEGHQIQLTVLKDHMLKNHGYYRSVKNGVPTSLVSCAEGVYRFTPPAEGGSQWTVEMLLDTPTSDAVFVDLDRDGEEELCTLAPFHGEKVTVYKKNNGKYEPVYVVPEAVEFTHAIYGGELCGIPSFVVGHRKGRRNLFVIQYHQKSESYGYEIIDEDVGPANVLHFVKDGKDILVAANREIDEIAYYTITEQEGNGECWKN